MTKYFTSFIILLSFNLFAQVSVNIDSLFFPQTITGTSDSASFYVKNNQSETIELKITNFKSVYTISDTLITITANDSSIIWLKYTPTQNVIDRDLLFITGDDSTTGIVVKVFGYGIFSDNYDATTFNLYDTELKNALTQLVSGHTALGYNLARDKMYMEIDNQRVNGQGATQNTLECVYTGRLAVGYVNRTDAQNNYNFNTEHTWPQSNFNEQEPMKSDLFHLYPTDNPANGVRSNYPFGNVVSNITWQVGGSKLGLNSLGLIVFEPRDVHKGNVARSMFYFITCYPVNYGGFFTQIQESVCRQWNQLDPVDTVEMARNNAIALLQLKLNPYIDHPEFVERIYSFATNNIRPVFAELNVLPAKVNFDSTLITNTKLKQVYIANSGSGQMIIDSITVSDSRFSVVETDFSVQPYWSIGVLLQFIPDSLKNYNAILSVYSNVGTKQIVLTGIGTDNAVQVDDKLIAPVNFSLSQNYPNPFNPSTTISWSAPSSSWQTLKIYDILGNEITTLVNEYRDAGYYEVSFGAQSSGVANSFPSGVYFYQLQAGKFIDTKKMLYLK